MFSLIAIYFQLRAQEVELPIAAAPIVAANDTAAREAYAQAA